MNRNVIGQDLWFKELFTSVSQSFPGIAFVWLYLVTTVQWKINGTTCCRPIYCSNHRNKSQQILSSIKEKCVQSPCHQLGLRVCSFLPRFLSVDGDLDPLSDFDLKTGKICVVDL